MTTLTALIERLASATEGSRELDAEISAEIRGGIPSHKCADVQRKGYEIGSVVHRAHYYTTSLDAALTLVPEGLLLGLRDQGEPFHEVQASLYRQGPNQSHLIVTQIIAKTRCLALCIVALRARSALTE